MHLIESDIDLIMNTLDDHRTTISHETFPRRPDDFKDAIYRIINEYDKATEDAHLMHEHLKYALRHIKKLESMLDKRNVRYKTWKEYEEEKGFW